MPLERFTEILQCHAILFFAVSNYTLLVIFENIKISSFIRLNNRDEVDSMLISPAPLELQIGIPFWRHLHCSAQL